MKLATFKEHFGRSLVKAITFRVLVLIADGIVIFALTHRYDTTLTIIFISNISSTILFLLHERAWNNVHWGKEKVPVKEI